jgi:gliding motility-associated-like protein
MKTLVLFVLFIVSIQFRAEASNDVYLPVEICNNGIDDDGDGFTDDDDTDCQWACPTQGLVRNKISATNRILTSTFQLYNDANGTLTPADTITYQSTFDNQLNGQIPFLGGLGLHPTENVFYAFVVDNRYTVDTLFDEYHYSWNEQRSQLVRIFKGTGVVQPVVEGVWIDASLQGAGFAPDGKLWAIDFNTFQLVNIDLETGTFSGISWDILNLGNVIIPNDVAFLDNGQALLMYNDYTYYVLDVETGVGYTMDQGVIDLSGFGPASMPFLAEGFCFTSNLDARGGLSAATETRLSFYEVSINDQLGRMNNPFTSMPLDTYSDISNPGYFNTGPGDMASCIFSSHYYDYGDVPSTVETNLTAARHGYNANLRLGELWDISIATVPASETTQGDDEDGLDDEDAVASLPEISGCDGVYSIDVNVTNQTGEQAKLIGWIDWNNNLIFEPNEGSVPLLVNSAMGLQQSTLEFSGIEGGLVDQEVYIRIRLSSDMSFDANDAYGTLVDGEVEDYKTLLGAKTPIPTAQFIQQFCLDTDGGFLIASGENLLWYTSSTGGVGSPSVPFITASAETLQFYYVSQTIDGCESARAEIRVEVVNCAPVLNDQVYSMNEDEQLIIIDPAFGMAQGDTDVNNNINPNGYSVVSTNGSGSFDFNNDGTFSYSPLTEFNGVFSFVYQGCDLTAPTPYCSQGEIVINVNPINDAPIAVNDSLIVDWNSVGNSIVAVNDTDIDSEVLVFTLLSSPIHGTIEWNTDGSFVYVPDGTFLGEEILEYEICDEEVVCDNAFLVIDIVDLTIDTDNDGLNDVDEDQQNSDPLDPCDPDPLALSTNDCDNDGLVNSQEFEAGTDPLNPDSDGDGFSDGNEVANSTDPLNSCDPDPLALATNDCDNDGLSNEQELEISTDPLDPDSDNDGDLDGQEVEQISDPLNPCDPDPLALSTNDCDEDGLDNAAEQDNQTNPLDPDSDNDGINDGQEVSTLTNPLDPCDPNPLALDYSDCDQDGLVNSTELEIGTDPLLADTDGDGLFDGEEVLAFDNPNTFPIAELVSDPLNPCDPDPTAVPEANCPIPVLDAEIPAGISPNGDGVGDVLIITNVELFPYNNITIFNRWGNIVYEKYSYKNEDPWDGTTKSTSVLTGEKVLEGTYFYLFDKGDGSPVRNGYIIVKYE